MNERKLSQVFDFQRFQQNARLAALISNVESRYAAEVSDDDLELVSAAGVPDINKDEKLLINPFDQDEEKQP